MANNVPCPLCDIEKKGLPDPDGPWQPADILAFGVALGVIFKDMHKVTECVCGPHRTHWVMSMLSAMARLEGTG